MLSLRAAMLGMALIITLPIGCSTIQKELYLRRSIPKKFHQTWYFVEGACNRFLSYQGAYAIGLRDDTIMQIEEQGLKFFSDIRDPANAAETNYYRGEWKPTPVPRAWYSEGAIPNLYCGAENALFLAKRNRGCGQKDRQLLSRWCRRKKPICNTKPWSNRGKRQ